MRILELNAEFDPTKARANHRKHGVGFIEAMHALQDGDMTRIISARKISPREADEYHAR